MNEFVNSTPRPTKCSVKRDFIRSRRYQSGEKKNVQGIKYTMGHSEDHTHQVETPPRPHKKRHNSDIIQDLDASPNLTKTSQASCQEAELNKAAAEISDKYM